MNEPDCNYQCINKTDGTICAFAPCDKRIQDFHIHERIVNEFIKKKDYAEAYYYLRGYLTKFKVQCDYKEHLELKRKLKQDGLSLDLAEIDLGCRLFIILDILKELLRDIEYYQAILDKTKQLSRENKDTLETRERTFIERMDSIFILLSHLYMDSDQKKEEHEVIFEDFNNSLATILRIENQTGVKLGVPQNFVFDQFKTAIKRSRNTPEQKKRAERNLEKLRAADNKEKLNQILDEITTDGRITDEMIDKLSKLE